jgi:hypothetical protein
MAFIPVDNLEPNPDVRIFFVGQMILEPLIDGRGCEVYVNRSAPDHHLSIEVRLKRPGKPDEIVLRHSGLLPFAPPLNIPPAPPPRVPPRHGLFIFVNPSPTGVKAYTERTTSTEGRRLSLALNMREIHDVATGPCEPIGGRPSILLNEGVFYTADVYPAGAKLKKKRPYSTPIPLGEFASIIGANIYLAANQRVQMIYHQNGRNVSLPLEKKAGQSHEIYITNEPPFQDDSPQAPFAHDEFGEYYKILRDIPNIEQFVLEVPAPRLGSLRTPCMSVLLDQ